MKPAILISLIGLSYMFLLMGKTYAQNTYPVAARIEVKTPTPIVESTPTPLSKNTSIWVKR